MFYDVVNGDEELGSLFKPLAVRASFRSRSPIRTRACLCKNLVKQLQRRLPVRGALNSLWAIGAKSWRPQTMCLPRAAHTCADQSGAERQRPAGVSGDGIAGPRQRALRGQPGQYNGLVDSRRT